jgi:hypothetical protein
MRNQPRAPASHATRPPCVNHPTRAAGEPRTPPSRGRLGCGTRSSNVANAPRTSRRRATKPRDRATRAAHPHRGSEGPAARRAAPATRSRALDDRPAGLREGPLPLQAPDPRRRPRTASGHERNRHVAARPQASRTLQRAGSSGLPNGSRLSCRRPCPTLPPFGRRRRVLPRARRRPAANTARPDAGGQLQRLVRQPSAPRDETNRSVHYPAFELAGRRRGVPLAREAMRSRVREPASQTC